MPPDHSVIVNLSPHSNNALVALVSILVFSTALGINISHGHDVTCGCFGGDWGFTSLDSVARSVFWPGSRGVARTKEAGE